MLVRTSISAGFLVLLGGVSTLAQEAPAPTRPAAAQEKKAEAKKSAVPADELVDEAKRSAQKGDMKTASETLERALKAEPTNRTALYLLAIVNQNRAAELERPRNSPFFLRSAEAMRKLRDTYKDLNDQEKFVLAMCLYTEATTYAAEGKTDKALAVLEEVVDSGGFKQVELLDEDDDLATLRKTPRFQALRKKVEEKVIITAREHAKTMLAEAQPFPFDFKLPGLDEKEVSLANFKGKVTIVDVWGTWCPPCRMEIPHFVDLYKKYHDKGLEIVGINYEDGDSKKDIQETIRAFLKENKVPYPCVIGDDKTKDQIPKFEGFPTTLFLDRSGKVRLKVVGYHSMADLDAIISMLLDEKPAPSE